MMTGCKLHSVTRRVLTVAVLLVGSAPLWAAEILTDDGSRLKGELLRFDAAGVVLQTGYAGEITIDRARVAGLISDEPVTVELDSGERLVGTVTQAEGAQQLQSERFGTVSFDADTVSAVWDADAPAPMDDDVQQAVAAVTAEKDAEIAELQEKQSQYEDPWSGSIGFGASGSRGNTEELVINANANFKREVEDDRLYLGALVNYTEQEDTVTANEYIANGRLEHDFSERQFVYGQASLESDEFEDIELRSRLLGGIGHFFIQEEDLTFKGLAGAGVQKESYDSGGSSTDPLLQLGYNLEYLHNDWVRFLHNLMYLPSLDDFGDYRLVLDASVELPLGTESPWAVRAGINSQYDSEPEPGVEDTDTKYLLNLVYTVK